LPTGRTPIAAYAELRRLHAAGDADFSRASSFNLDEFAGVGPSDPGSFRTFMDRHLFDAVNFRLEHIHFLNGAASALDAECDRYEAAIDHAGGIDLQLLGIGANGHIGFNEPGDELVARTHRVTLAESDQMVAEMQRRNIPVTYVHYSDEGHGFRRVENRRSFTAVVEAFLAQHLGGSCEPVGEDFAGSSIEFRAGRNLIPSLG